MAESGIDESRNERDAEIFARYFDKLQEAADAMRGTKHAWYWYAWADNMLDLDVQYLIPIIQRIGKTVRACYTDALYFDGNPAGSDWSYLIARFRDEILKRRASDPEVPSATGATPAVQVV